MSAAVSNTNGAATSRRSGRDDIRFTTRDGQDEEQQSLNHMRAGRGD